MKAIPAPKCRYCNDTGYIIEAYPFEFMECSFKMSHANPCDKCRIYLNIIKNFIQKDFYNDEGFIKKY